MRTPNGLKVLFCGTTLVMLAAAGVIACGDDDPDPGSNTPDSSTPTGDGSVTPPAEGGPGGDGSTGDGGPQAEPAKLLAVHAGTDFGNTNPSGGVRICFATAPAATPTDFAVAPTPAYPNTAAGLPAGTGGPMASTGLSLETINIQPYLIAADVLAAKGFVGAAAPTCDRLLAANFDAGAGPLVENTDYWKLPAIPAGTLKNDQTFLLAVTGCVQNTSIPFDSVKALCGQDFDLAPGPVPGLGNLKARLFTLDAAKTVAAGEIGAQVVHLSPSFPSAIAPALVEPGDGGADGGATPRSLVAAGQSSAYTVDGGAAPTLTTHHAVAGGVKAGDLLAFGPGAPENTLFPLAGAQQFSGGTTVANGKSYVFMYVGRADQSPIVDGQPNLKGLHPLVFPVDFTPPSFQ